jgi:4-hydroxy-3-polyprenylbenzoate decarboxylase
MVISGGPLDALDHASPTPLYGYRLGIDATKKLEQEGQPSHWQASGEEGDMSLPKALVSRFKVLDTGVFKGYALASVCKKEGDEAQKVREAFFSQPRHTANCLIIVDDTVDILNSSVVAWKLFNNIDAKRDLTYRTSAEGKELVVMDATKKLPQEGHTRLWPDDIVMSEEIKTLVDKNWEAYGL